MEEENKIGEKIMTPKEKVADFPLKSPKSPISTATHEESIQKILADHDQDHYFEPRSFSLPGEHLHAYMHRDGKRVLLDKKDSLPVLLPLRKIPEYLKSLETEDYEPCYWYENYIRIHFDPRKNDKERFNEHYFDTFDELIKILKAYFDIE